MRVDDEGKDKCRHRELARMNNGTAFNRIRGRIQECVHYCTELPYAPCVPPGLCFRLRINPSFRYLMYAREQRCGGLCGRGMQLENDKKLIGWERSYAPASP